jgi:hypothetical protein
MYDAPTFFKPVNMRILCVSINTKILTSLYCVTEQPNDEHWRSFGSQCWRDVYPSCGLFLPDSSFSVGDLAISRPIIRPSKHFELALCCWHTKD